MKHLVRPGERFAFDLDVDMDLDLALTEDSLLLPIEEKGRGKLFYLSRNWLGEKDTPSSRLLLAGIIEALTDSGDSRQAFLLVEEAVESLASSHSCSLAWHKIVKLGFKVYVAARSAETYGLEVPEGVLLVNEGEIADLLIRYEVVTLC